MDRDPGQNQDWATSITVVLDNVVNEETPVALSLNSPPVIRHVQTKPGLVSPQYRGPVCHILIHVAPCPCKPGEHLLSGQSGAEWSCCGAEANHVKDYHCLCRAMNF